MRSSGGALYPEPRRLGRPTGAAAPDPRGSGPGCAPGAEARQNGPVKRTAPAALRNRALLAEVLRRTLPPRGTVLELGSGTGEHAVFLARTFPDLAWQPSDPDPDARASIAAWAEEARLPNLLPPLHLDVLAAAWRRRRADALLCVNVLHVAPEDAVVALLAGAAEVLPAGGPLVVYGPFRRAGQADVPRLARIDATVRGADRRYGVRDAGALATAARARGLALAEEVPGAEEGDRLLVLRTVPVAP
jgi:SAM-dependent methyltransferase